MVFRCRANKDVDEIVEPFVKIALVSMNLIVFVRQQFKINFMNSDKTPC